MPEIQQGVTPQCQVICGRMNVDPAAGQSWVVVSITTEIVITKTTIINNLVDFRIVVGLVLSASLARSLQACT